MASTPTPTTPGAVRTRFDSHPDDYESQCMNGLRLSGEGMAFFARGRLQALADWWRAQGRPEPQRIVDYGCGMGGGTALVTDVFAHARVTGVDPSAEYIERARSTHAGDRLRFEALEAFDPHAARADIVHVNGVLHHVAPSARDGFFADSGSALAPGGVFALFENNPVNPGARMVMNRIAFDRDAVKVPPWEARRRLCDAGLRVATTRYLFFFPRPLRMFRALEPYLLRVPLGAQYGVFAVRER